jgi:serine/threonine protein kinase
MTLAAGSRLGPYEILVPLGAGGMGEVYRARDTRLERTVAVKVLPQHLSASAESRKRFESGAPRGLFEIRGLDAFNYSSPYTVTADGRRFLMIVRSRQARSSPISLGLNWTSGLPR